MEQVSGEAGNFQVRVRQQPRYVDMDKCIACGECAAKCPKKVDDGYDEGLAKRKAIYVKYSQAVPLKYCIDPEQCIYLTKGKCGNCAKVCPAGAINYEDTEKVHDLNVGSIILAPGTECYQPDQNDPYGYKIHKNVVTSIEFERILAASGPSMGHVIRPSDKQEPKKIAWIQCVGSRDHHEGAKSYCSSVCCTYAVKEASMAKDHVKGLDAAVFYIDIRTHGKDFEAYYNRAKDKLGVRFIKSRISNIKEDPETKDLILTYVSPGGERISETFGMVVLSVGLGLPADAKELAGRMGLELDGQGFPASGSFAPVASSREGIYICGAYQGPKDIPTAVVDASAAAAQVGALLPEARRSLTKIKEWPTEINVVGDPPRVGVFICHCGTNIAGVVDVEDAADYAGKLPFVAHVERNLFSCSQDSQEKIAQAIRDNDLNRVVIAACTPRTHEPLFQETLAGAGLNKYLFEMANIRNQCSWVHADDPAAATRKSKDLIRMAVAKAAQLTPLTQSDLGVNQKALIIGGGLAGMSAAKTLADQGYESYLVEQADKLGGAARSLSQTYLNEPVWPAMQELIDQVATDDKITVLTRSELKEVDGFVGNFKSVVKTPDGDLDVEHGVAILAMGGSELKPKEHLYGRHPAVVTGLEMSRLLKHGDPKLDEADSTVFIQCVGSRIPERPYCSKVCCTRSLVSAMELKERKPEMEVYILYRDLRTYGLREDAYRRAREMGVHFIKYDPDQGLTVSQGDSGLKVETVDYVLQRPLVLRPDRLVLASAILPATEGPIAQMFKVPINDDGFFVEAHVKLRPVDFATDGVFVAGLAHAPKSLDESIAQAQAAAARAVITLSAPTLKVGGIVSEIDQNKCVGCHVCVEVCPYKAISFNENNLAQVNEALCKGCGLCVSSCRSGAPSLKGFTEAAILDQVAACLN